jgi:hypothetical protein
MPLAMLVTHKAALFFTSNHHKTQPFYVAEATRDTSRMKTTAELVKGNVGTTVTQQRPLMKIQTQLSARDDATLYLDVNTTARAFQPKAVGAPLVPGEPIVLSPGIAQSPLPTLNTPPPVDSSVYSPVPAAAGGVSVAHNTAQPQQPKQDETTPGAVASNNVFMSDAANFFPQEKKASYCCCTIS